MPYLIGVRDPLFDPLPTGRTHWPGWSESRQGDGALAQGGGSRAVVHGPDLVPGGVQLACQLGNRDPLALGLEDPVHLVRTKPGEPSDLLLQLALLRCK